MNVGSEFELVRRCYRQSFDARIAPGFANFRTAMRHADHGAVLGYRRAGSEPLFLEAYLDRPVEQVLADALGCPVHRDAVIEIGNFASTSAPAMIALWTQCANDLGASDEIAVATLTAPLRSMFRRIGVPFTVLSDARPERLGDAAGAWGAYYRQDPKVCAGRIADGQAALARFADRRRRGAAA
ncbi:thermostable hemolysin [Novosphingobium lentum]|uniref:thermostable hemolysin n=1 Tax=Novosphingobium lentum TaxID=145287 RepID=UPI00082C6000|nr:thermostable hemolysin [Novosphingobium lentum]